MKKLLFSVLIVAVALFLWFALSTTERREKLEETPVETVTKTDGVVVAKTDITKGGSKLPQGFPGDIPVESISITDSYKAFYEKVNTTQYSVNYTSKRDREVLWETYYDFMNSSDYTVNMVTSSRNSGQINGTKGNDSLSVIITSNNGVSLVQISYLDR